MASTSSDEKVDENRPSLANSESTSSEVPVITAVDKQDSTIATPHKGGFAAYAVSNPFHLTSSINSSNSPFSAARPATPNPFQQFNTDRENNIFERNKRQRELHGDGIASNTSPDVSLGKAARIDQKQENEDSKKIANSDDHSQTEDETVGDVNNQGKDDNTKYSYTDSWSLGSSIEKTADKDPDKDIETPVIKTGEEDEIHILTYRAKLFIHDPQGKEYWKERGIGVLKLNVNSENSKKLRLVMRSDGTLRVILNVRLIDGMICDQVMDRNIRLHSYCDIETQQPVIYLLRFRHADDAGKLFAEISKRCKIKCVLRDQGQMPSNIVDIQNPFQEKKENICKDDSVNLNERSNETSSEKEITSSKSQESSCDSDVTDDSHRSSEDEGFSQENELV